jgi:hypothetical protein
MPRFVETFDGKGAPGFGLFVWPFIFNDDSSVGRTETMC